MAAAGSVAGARHGVAKNAVGILRIFRQRSSRQALLIAQFHPAKIEHRVLHGAGDALALAALLALKKRREDSCDEVNAGAGIADLRAGDERRTIFESRGARRAAGALGDIFVDLAVFVGAGAKTFHRSVDQARVEGVNRFPGKPLTIERAGREVLDHHVASLDQLAKHFLAFFMLGVDRDAALVAVEHGEIQAVDIGLVAQLAAGDIARGLAARP